MNVLDARCSRRMICVVCRCPRQMIFSVCHYRSFFFQSLLRMNVLDAHCSRRMICVVCRYLRRMIFLVCHRRSFFFQNPRRMFYPHRMICEVSRCRQMLSQHLCCLRVRFLVFFLNCCCRTLYDLLFCGRNRLFCCFPFVCAFPAFKIVNRCVDSRQLF